MTGADAIRPAIFASAFHPHIGGVEELVKQLAHELVRQGDTPLVVTNRYPKDLPPREQVFGLDVERFPFRVPEPTARQLGGWALYSYRTQREVAASVRRHRAGIVHVQCASSNGRYALTTARRLRLPLVVTLQGELTMDATGVYQRSAQLRRSWRALMSAADVVTACSEYVLREAEEVLGRSLGDRGRVVYNGIRPEDFAGEPATSGRPFVLGIGRHVKQKGFDILLRAFAEAMPSGTDLVLAGDGPERGALEALAKELGICDRVRFPGRVSHDEAVRLFLAADLFVLPSRHEPQGIVVLEAMAAGTPVFAASVGGVPEIVQDGVNGRLYPADDVSALAHLLRLDSAARRRTVAEARRTVAAHAWQDIARQYQECYELAVSRHGTRRR